MNEPPQVIPRPPRSEPGPPAPWRGLPVPERFDLAGVVARLEGPVDASERASAPKEAAVLALLWEEDGDARILLTRRAKTLRSHRHEVSFPGGRVERGETLPAAALRETGEEVGIPASAVRLIGTLTPLQTFSSGARVRPFIGVTETRPVLTVSPAEVERALDIRLTDLLADGVYRSERWWFSKGSEPRLIHFFTVPGDIIWGATGRMLWELLSKVAGVPVTIDPLLDALP